MRLRWARLTVNLGLGLCVASVVAAGLQFMALDRMRIVQQQERQELESLKGVLTGIMVELGGLKAQQETTQEAQGKIENNRFFQFRQEVLLALEDARTSCKETR